MVQYNHNKEKKRGDYIAMSNKVQLLDYQAEVLEDTKNLTHVAYFYDMGL